MFMTLDLVHATNWTSQPLCDVRVMKGWLSILNTPVDLILHPTPCCFRTGSLLHLN